MDSSSAVAIDTKPITPVSSVPVTYAPYVAPVTGNYDLCCVTLVWNDNPGTPLASVTNSGNSTAENFKRLSNGQFTFNTEFHRIVVPFDHKPQNVAPAVAYAKKQLNKTGKNVIYVMVNNNAGSISHSVGDTSNLLNALTTTFYHEVGRDDPLNLGSSGAFDESGKYNFQADGTTFMGHFASGELTASQLYGLGWLSNMQIAVYDASTKATVQFTLDPLNSTTTDGHLKAVLITNAPNTSKPLFLSIPTLSDGEHKGNPTVEYALHLAVGKRMSGSERLLVFGGKQVTTCRGLDFVQVSTDGIAATISISPTSATTSTPKPKPQ